MPAAVSSTSTSPDHSGQFPQQQQHLQLPQKKPKPKPQRKNLPNQKPQEKHVSKAVDAKDGELSSSDEEDKDEEQVNFEGDHLKKMK
ncbi:unnamed protein product, partial [Trichogramma brassicae]